MPEALWLCRDSVICMNNTISTNVCLNARGKMGKMGKEQGTDTTES